MALRGTMPQPADAGQSEQPRQGLGERDVKMDKTWTDRGEFATSHLGVVDSHHSPAGEWYIWETNGGTRGAHDRIRGDGRWVDDDPAPQPVSPGEARQWLCDHMGMDDAESCAEIFAALRHPDDRIVRSIGHRLWCSDDQDHYYSLYRIGGSLWSVEIGSGAQLVDADGAAEFVRAHGSDSHADSLVYVL